MCARKRMKIGEVLIQEELISKEKLQFALDKQKQTGDKIGEILVDLDYIELEKIVPYISEHLGVKHIIIQKEQINSDLKRLIPEDLMRRYEIFPINQNGNKLILAMSDPDDFFKIDEIQLRTKLSVRPVLSLRKNIAESIDFIALEESAIHNNDLYEILEDLYEFDDKDFEFVEETKAYNTEVDSSSAPVVKAVSALIFQAVSIGASDIHIEPFESEIRIRFRIDGVLQEIKRLPKKVIGPIVSRIKIISDLDIAEKRLPQDGRFKIKIKNNDVDFRVSTIPLVQGEKVVMRVLDKSGLKVDLKDLGLDEKELEIIKKAMENTYGMIITTGPTGSGKTTTLYSILNKLNNSTINISTAEDPVEFQIDGINQLQCNNGIDLNFASALKSFLRQDPDVIMIGEIRDYETAEISIKAALTGHLLLSTLHTNDAASTIQRLKNIGIEPYMISTSLLLIIAQRLGRKICENCKTEVQITKEEIEALNLKDTEYKNQVFYKGKGCYLCNNTGYKGRVGFYEVLEIDDEVRDCISRNLHTTDLKKLVIKKGMVTLREAGFRKAKEGITTIEEVLRVT